MRGIPYGRVYDELLKAGGRQGWWPGRTRLEVMVGAVLTQNTAWRNVEKAIGNLRARGWLKLEALHGADVVDLAEAIRPSGYFNVKAGRLRALTTYVMEEHGGSLNLMFGMETGRLREELLGIRGIGPETADSILLYAGRHPVFVIDAYTRRFMVRHGWAEGKESYDDLAAGFAEAFAGMKGKERVEVFNEFHALIVWLAKAHCRTKPCCGGCPLEAMLPRSGRRGA
ncbi:MAG TPA: endonuclease III domain-containing protein [Kiritimatiellia bacterium]|nr:endonuclease III domain-containing protein [Kiritimatiellia bacterium]